MFLTIQNNLCCQFPPVKEHQYHTCVLFKPFVFITHCNEKNACHGMVRHEGKRT